MTDSMTPSAEERAAAYARSAAIAYVCPNSNEAVTNYEVNALKQLRPLLQRAFEAGWQSREPEIEAARREQMEADCAVVLGWRLHDEYGAEACAQTIRAAFEAKEGKL